MFIINQDRNNSIEFTGDLNTKPLILGSSLIGFNLYNSSHLLGTFKSLTEIIKEMKNILRCKDNFYIVNGYENNKEQIILKRRVD